jgi:hypothetical protein
LLGPLIGLFNLFLEVEGREIKNRESRSQPNRPVASIGSLAVKSDAWHRRSDAITSALAFIGISIAVLEGPDGKDPMPGQSTTI